MYRVGFVPQQYVVDAICESQFKRNRSNDLNYQRQVYEAIENNSECMFGEMLDTEMRELQIKTHKMSYDCEVY